MEKIRIKRNIISVGLFLLVLLTGMFHLKFNSELQMILFRKTTNICSNKRQSKRTKKNENKLYKKYYAM